MLKFVGVVCVLGGTVGVLHSWIQEQKEQQKRMENFIFFLQKSRYVMSTEKIKIVDYLDRYVEQKDILLAQILDEIRKRLLTNTYPNGQMVWEEVFREEEEKLHFDKEVFLVIVQAGNGFFGRSREENISFLQKSIEELEQEQERLKEKSIQERKVWIPVGMLGSVMLVILLL